MLDLILPQSHISITFQVQANESIRLYKISWEHRKPSFYFKFTDTIIPLNSESPSECCCFRGIFYLNKWPTQPIRLSSMWPNPFNITMFRIFAYRVSRENLSHQSDQQLMRHTNEWALQFWQNAARRCLLPPSPSTIVRSFIWSQCEI